MKKKKTHTESINIILSLLRHHPLFIAGVLEIRKCLNIPHVDNDDEIVVYKPVEYKTDEVLIEKKDVIGATSDLLDRFTIPKNIELDIFGYVILYLKGYANTKKSYEIQTNKQLNERLSIDADTYVYIKISRDITDKEILNAAKEIREMDNSKNIGESVHKANKWGEAISEKILSGKNTAEILSEMQELYKDKTGQDSGWVYTDINKFKSRYKILLEKLAPLPEWY